MVSVDSPFRNVIDAILKNVLVHPQTHKPYVSDNLSVNKCEETKPQIYNEGYWLTDKSNGIILKNIIDYVKYVNKGCGIDVKLDNMSKYVHIIVSSSGKIDHDIYFDNNFPCEPPHIIYYDIYLGGGIKQEIFNPSCWSFDGDILIAFKNYYLHTR